MNTKLPQMLGIVERPTHSPHRAMLRGGVGIESPYGFDIYHIQERKTGAGRGCTPKWTGFDERDMAVMGEISRRWNAYPRLVEALRDAWRGDLPIERYAEIGALLRELG